MRRSIVLFVMAGMTVFRAPISQATIIHVPGDYSTIQAGINASANGDTVLVAPGTYTITDLPLFIYAKLGLSLISVAGPESTIIISQNDISRPKTIWIEDSRDIAINGFSITHSPSNWAGGIIFQSPLPSMNNSVTNCKIYNTFYGIEAGSNNRWGINIANNKIFQNNCDAGAIYLSGDCFAVIDSNEIFNNISQGVAAILCAGSAEIRNNRIYNNLSNSPPNAPEYGIICVNNQYSPAESVVIENNLIYSNSGTEVGGIAISGRCLIRNNIINDNYGGIGASGIYVYGTIGNVVVSQNDIFNNVGYGLLTDNIWVISENNYWGHSSGPYNPQLNPNGLGNAVSSNVDFIPWSSVPINVENRPPSAVEILSPANGQVCGLDSWLTWTKSIDPDAFDIIRYHLQVDDDPAFTSPEINFDSLSDELLLDESISFELGSIAGSDNLIDNSAYFWRVRAIDMFSDSSEWTDGSHWFYFRDINDPPAPPISGFSPSDYEEVISLSPTITWNHATDPDPDDDGSNLHYVLHIFADTSMGQGYTYSDTTNSGINQVVVSDTMPDNFLFIYRVMTVDDEGLQSGWSEMQHFWTNHYNFPPEPFPLFGPTDGQRQVVFFTHFAWGGTVDLDPNSAFTYSLQYSPDSLFRFDVGSVSTLADTAISIPTDSLALSGQVFWRVLAVDDDSLIRIGGIPGGPKTITVLPPGDANASGLTNGIDVTFLVSYLKGQGAAPDPILAGDANGNCQTNGIDVTYLVSYFKGIGAAPVRPDCDVVIAGGPKPLKGGR